MLFFVIYICFFSFFICKGIYFHTCQDASMPLSLLIFIRRHMPILLLLTAEQIHCMHPYWNSMIIFMLSRFCCMMAICTFIPKMHVMITNLHILSFSAIAQNIPIMRIMNAAISFIPIIFFSYFFRISHASNCENFAGISPGYRLKYLK